jgi:hypothetical protein
MDLSTRIEHNSPFGVGDSGGLGNEKGARLAPVEKGKEGGEKWYSAEMHYFIGDLDISVISRLIANEQERSDFLFRNMPFATLRGVGPIRVELGPLHTQSHLDG